MKTYNYKELLNLVNVLNSKNDPDLDVVVDFIEGMITELLIPTK